MKLIFTSIFSLLVLVNVNGQEPSPSVIGNFTKSAENISDVRAQAELEKLRLEIQSLKSKNGWGEKVAQFTPLFTVLIAVAGFCFGVYQFNIQQKENIKKFTSDQNSKLDSIGIELGRDRAEREKAFNMPLFERYISLCLEASNAAAIVAIASDPNIKKKAEEEFLKIWIGPLHALAPPDIIKAMAEFERCLNDQSCRESDLPNKSKELAKIMGKTFGGVRSLLIGNSEEPKPEGVIK
jgi:hypothetical protein